MPTMIPVCTLTATEYNIRMNLRNFLLTATDTELRNELQRSLDTKNWMHACFIWEMIDENN